VVTITGNTTGATIGTIIGDWASTLAPAAPTT